MGSASFHKTSSFPAIIDDKFGCGLFYLVKFFILVIRHLRLIYIRTAISYFDGLTATRMLHTSDLSNKVLHIMMQNL